jgi:hypothetical protein
MVHQQQRGGSIAVECATGDQRFLAALYHLHFRRPSLQRLVSNVHVEAVKDAIVAFRDADCDEVVLAPCDPDLGKVDTLAAVALTSV